MDDRYYAFIVAGLAKEGTENHVLNFLKELMTKSRQDEGCIIYNIHQSTDNHQEFVLYSLWENREAFERHNQTPHMQAFKHELHKKLFDKESAKTYWNLL
ncbi:MAG: antibiotic biosynthesis monooxygenase [Gammaproteobacteria bacterium]|nr:antibiotic biosynthesis monooxygenase [Gammaproteobacteria bacterium]